MKKKKTLIIAVIAAVVLVGVMLLLIFLPKSCNSGADSSAATGDEADIVQLSTDSKGVHQVKITDEKKAASGDSETSGTLIEYTPSQLKNMHVENKQGSFDVTANTPEGEATVYTLVGYEDFDLQTGAPDAIANAAARLEFSMLAGEDNGGSDFGFDKPRSVVTVEYTDGTKSVFTLGNDAPQNKGTYAKFGDSNEIFVVNSETVAAFDYGVTDLISLTINNSADDEDNAQASEINITANGESVKLVPNTDNNLNGSYFLTEPVRVIAGESESSKIEGGIRGLYADKVVMVNPSSGQLSELGLSEPYATVKAVYPDTTVSLSTSKPDSEGKVNLMVDGRKVVYTLSAEKVAWVTTSRERLKGDYVLPPKMTSLKTMTINDTKLDLSSRESTVTDDQGSETTSTITTVFRGTEELQLENFSPFFDEAAMIALADDKAENPTGKAALTIAYTYAGGGSDKAEFYEASDNRYIAVLNGTAIGHARKSDITRVLDDLKKL